MFTRTHDRSMRWAMPAAAMLIAATAAWGDAAISVSSTRPAVKRFDSDIEEWHYSTPTPADIITWISGVNWADRSRFRQNTWTERKFNFEGGLSGRTLTGFSDNDGPGILGSTTSTIGGGFSEIVAGSLYSIPTCRWSVGVGGSLGAGQGAYWHAKAHGLDPFHFTAADFTDAGITEDVYDFFVVAGFDAGTEVPVNERMELNVWYDFAGESVSLLRLIAREDRVNGAAPMAPEMELYLVDEFDEGPAAISGAPLTIDEIKTLLADSLAVDGSLAEPFYVGVHLNDVPVPTEEMGDGNVMRCRIETTIGESDSNDGTEQYRLPWSDDFDLYDEGVGVIGQSDWEGFNMNEQLDAIVNPFITLTPPNSLDVIQQTDVIHPILVGEEDAVQFRTWMLIPPDYQSNGGDPFAGSQLRLLDQYEPDGPFHVGFLARVDSNDQMFKCYCGNGNQTVDVPYIVDQWVPIDVHVDLSNDSTSVFYDNQLVCEYAWTAGAFGDGQGQPQIAAVNLFGNGATSVFYDDLVLVTPVPECPADLDGDGAVNVTDLLDLLAQWGGPGPADLDGDGTVAVGDLLVLLAGWGECPQQG